MPNQLKQPLLGILLTMLMITWARVKELILREIQPLATFSAKGAIAPMQEARMQKIGQRSQGCLP